MNAWLAPMWGWLPVEQASRVWPVVLVAAGSWCWRMGVLLRRTRRQARWPDGKP